MKSLSEIKIEQIYDKNINFIFGAGSSYGMLPTLELKIKDENGQKFTIESLGKKLEDDNNSYLYGLLFVYYYSEVILKAQEVSPEKFTAIQKGVIDQYSIFLKQL